VLSINNNRLQHYLSDHGLDPVCCLQILRMRTLEKTCKKLVMARGNVNFISEQIKEGFPQASFGPLRKLDIKQ